MIGKCSWRILKGYQTIVPLSTHMNSIFWEQWYRVDGGVKILNVSQEKKVRAAYGYMVLIL